jgi:hypothetical protein
MKDVSSTKQRNTTLRCKIKQTYWVYVKNIIEPLADIQQALRFAILSGE